MSFADDLSAACDDIMSENDRTVTYNGTAIDAIVKRGADRDPKTSDAVADKMTIRVRKTDIATFSKGTVVVVDGETWQVWAREGETRVFVDLALIKAGAPKPRRSF